MYPCGKASGFSSKTFTTVISDNTTRQGNVGTSQAVETPLTTTRGGSKPFAHIVHSVRHDDDSGDFSTNLGVRLKKCLK